MKREAEDSSKIFVDAVLQHRTVLGLVHRMYWGGVSGGLQAVIQCGLLSVALC
jgi:hypothetical protein